MAIELKSFGALIPSFWAPMHLKLHIYNKIFKCLFKSPSCEMFWGIDRRNVVSFLNEQGFYVDEQGCEIDNKDFSLITRI